MRNLAHHTIVFFGTLLFILVSCKKEKPTPQELPMQEENSLSEPTSLAYRENFRPQYHFTPPEKWMNDPNGLLFHNGTYHLFYQYYPEDIVWGPMHWGHATSKDLITWEHKPIALYPDELGYIFSGSAVMDTENTSGLGTKENPPMVAIFTHHDMDGEKAGRLDYQVQSIAYSLDEGTTWEKYEGNPVIPNDTGIKDFRDPKVMWYEPSKKWIMSLVAGDHALFYSSSDLKDWRLLSTFGKNKGAHGGVWECPDLFPLQIEGTDETKWVLFISINPGAPNGGSGTQYFIGDWDGSTFTTDQTEDKWIDWGADNYAGVTFNGLADDDRTFIGWMSNWNYADKTPTEIWRSAMTLPRKLTLHKNAQGYYLKNHPLASIKNYEQNTKMETVLKTGMVLSNENFNQTRLDFEISGVLSAFSITFSNDKNESLRLGYDEVEGQFWLDRRDSGRTEFESRFADRSHTAPAILDGVDDVTFSIFLDASSIELFIDGGATVMTEQVFPTAPYTEMKFESDKAMIGDLKISDIKRIW